MIDAVIPGVSSKSIDTTTLVSLHEQSVASVVRKIDDLPVTVEFDPTKDYAGAVGSACESIILTMLKLVGTQGYKQQAADIDTANVAASVIYDGMVEKQLATKWTPP